MEDKILGLHHITAIAASAQRNHDFYTKVLAQRLVKKTVNFDDPGTYHFYYGDEHGSPGTILTFFPWEGIGKGRVGAGMATQIGYAIPKGSLEFWQERFKKHSVKQQPITEIFGESCLPFEDPDGLKIVFVELNEEDLRLPWETDEVKADVATRGFHHATLTVKEIKPTAELLTGLLGYRQVKQEGNLYRFATDTVKEAAVIDLVEEPLSQYGITAAGTNHHIAFRVQNDDILMHFRDKALSMGLNITPKIDRDYFFSLYFREPGGVLFELATDNPGFTRDEALNELGKQLRLPKQYEGMRGEIEKALPPLK